MKTKGILIFTACALIALTLAGCSDGRVQSSGSIVSDIQSALDPDSGSSSGFPDEEEQSSMPDYESSQGGGVNSGSSDLENGTESGGSGDDISSGDGASSEDEASSGGSTKDV